jgi:alkylation response protein AidB-like acyl-CoA dehydrogenase
MEFKFSEREELLRKTIREYAEKEITTRKDEMEETGEFPVDLLPSMGKMGILGVITPQEYGGTGMGSLARIIVLEAFGGIGCSRYAKYGRAKGG